MRGYALVNVPAAPLMAAPTEQCELADEALHGMKVELLECAGGWARVRTHYRYEGYTRLENLAAGDALLARWDGLPKLVVRRAQADVLCAPAVQGWRVASLPRGAVVAVRRSADGDGWVRLALSDGREGYARAGHLGEYTADWSADDEPGLRKKIVDTALSYLGVQYRWGGKTPQGIDCSGLGSMAYLLNGVVIYRDADIREGFCMRKIPVEQSRAGDLLFFQGHVAVHLGGGRYVHATAAAGSDGVVLNSLNPGDDDYRADLPPLLRFAGTIF